MLHQVEYGTEDTTTQEGARKRFNRLAGDLGLSEDDTKLVVNRLQRGMSTEDDRQIPGFDKLSAAWEYLDELSDHS